MIFGLSRGKLLKVGTGHAKPGKQNRKDLHAANRTKTFF